ncbi:MAG: uncharacterized protein KVP18_001534 [Porospora cf. gigantea A]|uniref:uncharacterized protein n=1 Tax=Porospora cf. gigantea A TaxID=2853593 RepID=UPI00355A7BCD|nr:MAG: hypothetical protein KVP18_001534 [Porospora cf. gigantea A]
MPVTVTQDQSLLTSHAKKAFIQSGGTTWVIEVRSKAVVFALDSPTEVLDYSAAWEKLVGYLMTRKLVPVGSASSWFSSGAFPDYEHVLRELVQDLNLTAAEGCFLISMRLVRAVTSGLRLRFGRSDVVRWVGWPTRLFLFFEEEADCLPLEFRLEALQEITRHNLFSTTDVVHIYPCRAITQGLKVCRCARRMKHLLKDWHQSRRFSFSVSRMSSTLPVGDPAKLLKEAISLMVTNNSVSVLLHLLKLNYLRSEGFLDHGTLGVLPFELLWYSYVDPITDLFYILISIPSPSFYVRKKHHKGAMDMLSPALRMFFRLRMDTYNTVELGCRTMLRMMQGCSWSKQKPFSEVMLMNQDTDLDPSHTFWELISRFKRLLLAHDAGHIRPDWATCRSHRRNRTGPQLPRSASGVGMSDSDVSLEGCPPQEDVESDDDGIEFPFLTLANQVAFEGQWVPIRVLFAQPQLPYRSQLLLGVIKYLARVLHQYHSHQMIVRDMHPADVFIQAASRNSVPNSRPLRNEPAVDSDMRRLFSLRMDFDGSPVLFHMRYRPLNPVTMNAPALIQDFYFGTSDPSMFFRHNAGSAIDIWSLGLLVLVLLTDDDEVLEKMKLVNTTLFNLRMRRICLPSRYIPVVGDYVSGLLSDYFDKVATTVDEEFVLLYSTFLRNTLNVELHKRWQLSDVFAWLEEHDVLNLRWTM